MGRRVTVGIDRGVLQLAVDGVLLGSLPNPLTPAEIARIRDARPAGPAPGRRLNRSGSSRGVFSRGPWWWPGSASTSASPTRGHTLHVEPADRTIRVYDDAGVLLAEVPCTTTKTIARFKVRKAEPRRRST